MLTSPEYSRLVPSLYAAKTSVCPNCGHASYPTRSRCPICSSQKLESGQLPHCGTVITYTEVYRSTPAFEGETPYFLVVVDMEDVRVLGQLTDVHSASLVTIGMQVERVVRRIGQQTDREPIVYGIKFRPLFEGNVS